MKTKKQAILRILMISIITSIAMLLVAPNFLNLNDYQYLPQQKINLGLDLKGGAHLLLKVDFDTYVTDQLSLLNDNFRKSLRSNKIGYKALKLEKQHISIELRDKSNYQLVQQILKTIDSSLYISSNIDNTQLKISFKDYKLKNLNQQIIDSTIEIIRRRVDSLGTTEPLIQQQGKDDIIVEVPGIQNSQHLKQLVGKVAKLGFHIVEDEVEQENYKTKPIPRHLKLVKDDKNNYTLLVIKQPAITGDLLQSADVSLNMNSKAVVNIVFNNLGSKIFADLTKLNQGKKLAIVLDDKLLSAPVISEAILGGTGVISGNFSIDSANELSVLLRSGALPSSLKIIEERIVGASLGADAINSGKIAGIVGFFLVNIFMLLIYGILGLFANIALLVSLIYMLAALSLLQATLTLPGIAGIILTIGMAVDANVLIYERIREEISKGISIQYAVKKGFETAFATIADSNITTLLAAIMLYIFGVGAIKGFAVTLSVGILSSMFSAIVVTKILIEIWVKYNGSAKEVIVVK